MTQQRTTSLARGSDQGVPAPSTIVLDKFGYRHSGRKNWALRNLSLTISPGEKVLIAGASGAGKSTLLHAITGVLGKDEGDFEGTITLAGEEPTASGVRGEVGLVLQDPESQRVMERVGDEVAFGLENLGVPQDRIWPRVERALNTVGLTVPLHHPTSALSGGQKQRLAVACALAMEPKVLALDEPTANLDPAGTKDVLEATLKVVASSPETTLLVVDHNMTNWVDVVDRLVVITPDGVVADGPPKNVLFEQAEELNDLGIWVPNAPAYTPKPLPARAARNASAVSHPATAPVAAVSAPAPAVRALEVSLGYEPHKPIASGIDLEVPAGQTTFILGPNGIGKSTLALSLAGLMSPLKGEVAVSPQVGSGLTEPDPNKWKTGELLGRVSMVFQEPQYQFLTGSVADELAVGPRLSGWTDAQVEEETEAYLELLGLTHLAGAHPMSLSGGERRRLAVGTALISAPRLLVLDEPTFGQDRKTWEGLVDLLAHAQSRGTTLVIVTHDQHLTEALGDHVIDLAEVVGVSDGEPNGVNQPNVGALEGDTAPKGMKNSPETGQATASSEGLAQPWYGSPLARVNPAVQVLALVLLTVPLMFSIDPVSALVALGLELALLPLAKLKPKQLLVRVAPLLIAAPLAGVSMLLYGRIGGEIYFSWGPIVVSQNSALLAGSLSLRVLAVGLPAVVILPSISATALADSLIQVVKLPAKFVVASLAGMRMVGLMMTDWRALGRARRSRGLAGTHFFKSLFQLLTFALRRGEQLSVSMEARGFGAPVTRTNARASTLSKADILAVLVSVGVPAIALGAAAALGTFTLFGLR